MAHLTTNWQTWKPEIDAYIQDEKAAQPKSVYSQLFDVRSTNRLQINDVTYSGMSKMESVGELGDAVEDESLEGYTTSYSRSYYRKSATFSAALMQTDQTGTVETLARDLARLPEYTRNLEAFSVFRRGWDTTKTYGNAKQLISVSLPRKDGGGTQYNTFSDGVQRPLTYDNALDLQDQLIALLSNSGNLMGVGDMGRNKTILCSPYLREDAFQIAGVNGPDKEPDTNENNMNFFRKGDKFDVLCTQWISYEAAVDAAETAVAKTSASNYWDSMWFIVDTTIVKRYLKFFFSEGYAKYDDEITKANEALVKYVYDSFAYGVSSPIFVVGSKGDNTTFAS
jgi:hypothetical protein